MGVQKKIAGHDLLRRVGAERVDARQIDHGAVLLPADGAGFLVDRDAGEIADMLVGACQLVEQRRFSTVRVTCKCNFDSHILPLSDYTSQIIFSSI